MRRQAAIVVAIVLFPAGYWLTLHSTRQTELKSSRVLPATARPPSSINSRPAAGLVAAPVSLNRRAAAHPRSTVTPTKRSWDTNFLAKLGPVFEGKPIQFQLPDGQVAAGTILRQQSSGAELVYVSGQLATPAPGRFFFQKQSLPGITGPFVGVVEFPGLGTACRIEPTKTGNGTEF